MLKCHPVFKSRLSHFRISLVSHHFVFGTNLPSVDQNPEKAHWEVLTDGKMDEREQDVIPHISGEPSIRLRSECSNKNCLDEAVIEK